MRSRVSVHGLTSAATLWAVSVLGLLIGLGHYLIGVIYTGFIILILYVFGFLEDQFLKKTRNHYLLKTREPKTVWIEIKKIALHEGLKFKNLSLKKEDPVSSLEFTFQTNGDREEKFRNSLLDIKDILEIKIE
jgi:putative Mg2+ transporter-C (MgtC) family protein